LLSACALIALVFAALSAARLLHPLPALAASGVLTVQTALHDAPDPAASVITVLPEGSEVVIDGPPVAGFYPVTAGGIAGWMRGETLLLTKDVPADTGAEVPPAQTLDASPAEPVASADAYPLQEAVTTETTAESVASDVPVETEPTVTEPPSDSSLDSAAPTEPIAPDPVSQAPADTAAPIASDAETLAVNADEVAADPAQPTSDGAPADSAPATDENSAPADNAAPTGPASVPANAPIRTGPGPDFDLIFDVPGGSTVEQTGQVTDGYVTVRYKEVVGWIELSKLAPPSDFAPESLPEETTEPVETKVPRPGSGVAYTTVDLSLREGPSASASAVTVVPAGSRVVLTGVMEGGFQRVTYREQIGWIANDYLQNPPNPEDVPRGATDRYSRREIVRIIYAAADRYGQSREDMLRVAQCESNLNPYAVHPSGSYGLFQFIRTTWKSTPYGNKDVFDPEANANAAGWMWSQGRRSEWVCQ
jgi:uncharacterized protein YraI